MIGIVLIGLGLRAVVRPSEFASWVAFVVGSVSLLVAAWGVFRTCRGFFAGFLGYLILGGGYFAICFCPWVPQEFVSGLPTSQWSRIRYEQLNYTPTTDGESVWVCWGKGVGMDCEQGDYDRDRSHAYSQKSGGNVYYIRVQGVYRYLHYLEIPRGLQSFDLATWQRVIYSNAVLIPGPSGLRAFEPETMQRTGNSLSVIFLGAIGALLAISFAGSRLQTFRCPLVAVDPTIKTP
jgi:hypothetical protein